MKPSEFECISLLSEECGETVQAIGKILRHGLDNGWNEKSNREYLQDEISDLIGVIKLMLAMKGLLDHEYIYKRVKNKFTLGGIDKYLHSFKTNILKHIFMVRYEIGDYECTRPVTFDTTNVEYIRRKMEEYFDINYLENVKVMEIVPMEEWIQDQMMKI